MASPKAQVVEQQPRLPTADVFAGGKARQVGRELVNLQPWHVGTRPASTPALVGGKPWEIGVFDVIASGMGGMYDKRAAGATQIYSNQLNALAAQNNAMSINKVLGDLIAQGFTPEQALEFADSPQSSADFMLRQLLGMG